MFGDLDHQGFAIHVGHECAEVLAQERLRRRVDREVHIAGQALPTPDRRANRMHFELQPKPGRFCFGEPLIRGSERLELEARESLATSCRPSAKIHDWLKDWN